MFIDARSNAAFSKPLTSPVKIADYPQATLAFLIGNADLICALVDDCRKPAHGNSIEEANAVFDVQAEDPRWVVRLYTNEPWDAFIVPHRPTGACCLASPIYESEAADA